MLARRAASHSRESEKAPSPQHNGAQQQADEAQGQVHHQDLELVGRQREQAQQQHRRRQPDGADQQPRRRGQVVRPCIEAVLRPPLQ